jgi:hypothetical protein
MDDLNLPVILKSFLAYKENQMLPAQLQPGVILIKLFCP